MSCTVKQIEVPQLTQAIEDERVVVSLQGVAIAVPNPDVVPAEAVSRAMLRGQGQWAAAKFVPVESLPSVYGR